MISFCRIQGYLVAGFRANSFLCTGETELPNWWAFLLWSFAERRLESTPTLSAERETQNLSLMLLDPDRASLAAWAEVAVAAP
jgi:hypothetical protein